MRLASTLCTVLLLAGCDRAGPLASGLLGTLELAGEAERHQRHAEAYQLYARAIEESAELLHIPVIDRPRSPNDVYLWFGTVLSAYIGRRASAPSGLESERSFERLRVLESELDYPESEGHVEASLPLTIEEFLSRWGKLLFPDRVRVPESLAPAVERAFGVGRFSIVLVQGDTDSALEGLLFSPEYRWAVPLRVEQGAAVRAVFLLPPGEWSAISRVAVDGSEPDGSGRRRGGDGRDEYAVRFFEVPSQPHEVRVWLSARNSER